MIHHIILNVNSVIDNLTEAGLPDGEPEISIFEVKGIIKESEGTYEIKYAEESEGGRTSVTLLLSDKGARLERHGACECIIPFTEGETVKTVYSVPPYSFDMTVSPLRVRSELTGAGGTVSLIYLMNIGGQDKKVRLRLTARAVK